MVCLTCKQDVKVEFTEDSVVYLSCRHKAKLNDQVSYQRVWNGLLDGERVTIDLTNSILLPLKDLDSGDKWIANRVCPTCAREVFEVGQAGEYIKLACGHRVERMGNGELLTVTDFVHSPRPEPEQSLDVTPRPPIGWDPDCPTCGKKALEIGSIQVAGERIILKLKCGHRARRLADSTLEAV